LSPRRTISCKKEIISSLVKIFNDEVGNGDTHIQEEKSPKDTLKEEWVEEEEVAVSCITRRLA